MKRNYSTTFLLKALAVTAFAAATAACGGGRSAGGGGTPSPTPTASGAPPLTTVARPAAPPAADVSDLTQVGAAVTVTARTSELTFTTPAIADQTKVRVTVPADYDPNGTKRYPVVYLLHGGGSNYTSWTSAGINLEDQTPTTQAIALMLLLASVDYPQALKTYQDRDTPDFRVQVWGDVVRDFSMRVQSYFDLRSELEKGLPVLTVTDNPAEIRRGVRALAKRIRVARAEAKQGDIFTPPISVEFRKALLLEMNASTQAAIMDDNPGEFPARINSTYPERKPISTVPPNILAALPRLPDDIEYRFVGRHLILLDTRASLIIDRILYAIQCADSDTVHR